MKRRLQLAGRIALTCLMDCAFLLAAYALSILLYTYILQSPQGFTLPFLRAAPWMALGCAAVFALFGVYRDMWRFLSMLDALRMATAAAVAAFVGYAILRATRGGWPAPIIGVTAFYLFATLSVGARMLPSIAQTAGKYFLWKVFGRDDRAPLLIVGAGEAAAALIKDLQNQGKDCPQRIVGAVDDDPAKYGHALRGVRVLGTSEDIPTLVKKLKVQEIIIAVPSATTEQRRRLISLCAPTGAKVRAMGAVASLGEASVTAGLHNLDVSDLLGRREVVLDPADMEYLTGAVVLVTGGGGSIGSELCRQILRFEPEKLIIFDFYENNAYDLQRELRMTHRQLADRVLLRVGSVQDRERLSEVFAEFRPQVVFHAAAYKHVSLMEQCPELAIENNVFGSFNVASACVRHGARRMVMVSTDKAVNPTNVMGASKRLAEMVVQSMNGQGTDIAAVRFGNVLGSNGSIVPLFRRQIEAGGPVTITHPEIIRYFMTIPEAARLVLRAGGLAGNGETFVLDMGEPVKMLDLAHAMIRMAGLEPERDIPIEIIGLLPGEKLYEELLLTAEETSRTADDKVFIAHSPTITPAQRRELLDRLHRVVSEHGDIKACIRALLPTYHPENGG